MTARAILVLFLTAASVVAAPVPKEIKAKGSHLDGRWEVVELWSGLLEVTELNPWVWEIGGEQLTTYRKENGNLTVYDPATKTTLLRPTGGGSEDIDYIRDDGKTAMVFKGTVVVVGDELIICFDSPGKPRPTERKPFQSGWYYRFKRVKE